MLIRQFIRNKDYNVQTTMVGVPALQDLFILVRERREMKFKDLAVHLV